jgi:hypothetical protein
MAMDKESRFKPSLTIDRTDLKAVAGMLRQAPVEKLNDVEKRIGDHLLAEDDATKSK